MPALKVRNTSVLAKIESSYGVDIVPAAANGLWCIGSPPEPQSSPNSLADVIGRGSLSKIPNAAPGERHWMVNLKVPLRGAGAAYSTSVKPKISPLLRACGLQETVTTTGGAEKVVYVPRSTGFESISLHYNWDGLLYKLLGAFGTVNFVCKSGGVAFAEFQFRALYAAPTDVAIVLPTGEPTVVHPIFQSGAFQIGTENYASPFSNINLNLNNTLTPSIDPSSATGVSAINLLNRVPNGSFDPDAVLKATFDWHSKWENGTLMDMSFQIGTAQYNRIKFSCPEVQSSDVKPGNRSDLGLFTVPFNLVSDTSAAEDELSISFD